MTAMRFRTIAGSVTVALLVAAGCTPQTSATAETPLIVPPPLQQAAADPAPSQQPSSPQQLDQLVAPIALYPDALLAQVLMAATFPQDGKLYQKNLGPDGAGVAAATKTFDPDPSWQPTAP